MICENCNAQVPKVYQGADGRKYCCAGCLFHPEAKHDDDCTCTCCQPVSHCCENNLHFDCSGSVIDDTDGNFNHRGKCFCECHSPRTEKQPLKSAVAVEFDSSPK